MFELPDFFLRALLGVLLLALVAGPVGCLVVWRRMAFFGDTLAHAALLGIALSLALKLPVALGILLSSVMIALLLARLNRHQMASDTLLGVLSPTALALGLIALSRMPGVRVDLMGYLFGDILAISWNELAGMAVASLLVLTLLAVLWKKFLATVIAPDLATVEGLPVRKLESLLLVLLACVIALGIQLVGVLLLTALLLIPAATARRFASTPEQMAVGAALCGMASGVGGLLLSYFCDLPAGPAIVVAAAGLLLLGSVARARS